MLRSGGTVARKRTHSNPSVFETPPPSRPRQDMDETDIPAGEGARVVRSLPGSSGGTGNSGQHGIVPGESVSPIPRPLPFKHVTFSFVQRSWEEIDTSLSTLPISIALYPVLDDEMINVIRSVLPCCLGFRIHTPHVRMSNFIVLTDELQVKASTPTEMSSFVQQSKLIHYMPKYFVTTGYTLSNRDEPSGINYSSLFGHNRKQQMVRLPNTEDFETLKIMGIDHSIHGNLMNRNKMYQGYVLNDLESHKYELLAQASTDEEKAWNNLAYAYGVIDEEGDKTTVTSKWSIDKRAISKCKNLDKIEIVGASDTIEFDVETNLEGEVLYPDEINQLTPGLFTYFVVKGIEKHSQLTLWKCGVTPWPSTFNPKMHRSTAALGDRWLHAQYKPLQHHFFTMVPIHKSNGTLMKQRSSCMVEQSFQISFIFRDEEISAMAPLDMTHLRARGGMRLGVQHYEPRTTLPFLT